MSIDGKSPQGTIDRSSTDSLLADDNIEWNDAISSQAVEVFGTSEMVERIDHTLDLLADAATGLGVRPIDQSDLTIIVPVFNERQTIAQVLRRIDEVMPPACQVIVVDDGSTDGTSDWLRNLPARDGRKIICRRRNHGKGSAIRLAIRHSVGSVVAIQDADLEYDPADLLRVVWPILDGDAEVVYGSRYLTDVSDPSWLHRIGNWSLTNLSNALTGLRLSDMETCHKAFDGDLIRSIRLRESRFGFEPEVTAKVACRSARILEVPTNYKSRSYEDGKKIGWRDGLAAIRCMWRYRAG